METVKLKVNGKRSDLGEGRNVGMGYAMAIPTTDGYETIMPFTCCKDFLNDVVVREVEPTIKEGKVFGFTYDYTTAPIRNREHCYMALRILLGQHSSSELFDAPNTVKLLQKADVIIKALNQVESKYNLSLSEPYFGEDFLLIEYDPRWARTTVLMSLFTLIIRIAFYWDGKTDFNEFMNKGEKYCSQDRMLAQSALKVLNNASIEQLLEALPEKGTSVSSHHSCGVCWYAQKNKL